MALVSITGAEGKGTEQSCCPLLWSCGYFEVRWLSRWIVHCASSLNTWICRRNCLRAIVGNSASWPAIEDRWFSLSQRRRCAFSRAVPMNFRTAFLILWAFILPVRTIHTSLNKYVFLCSGVSVLAQHWDCWCLLPRRKTRKKLFRPQHCEFSQERLGQQGSLECD